MTDTLAVCDTVHEEMPWRVGCTKCTRVSVPNAHVARLVNCDVAGQVIHSPGVACGQRSRRPRGGQPVIPCFC